MLKASLKGHTDRVWKATWNPVQPLIASCSGDKSIRIWKNFVLETTIDMAHQRTIRCVAFNNDGLVLASCSFDATTAIWEKNGSEFECLATLEGHENEVKCCSWSASGELLATCGRDKSVWIWNAMEDGDFECVAVLHEHTEDVKAVMWHPHQEILASASYDNTIKFFKDEDDDWFCYDTLQGHSSTVWAIDFDKTGSFMVSVGDDKKINVWKEQNQKYQLFCSAEANDTIYSVSWSKLHGKIAICGRDNSITIYKLEETLLMEQRIEEAHGDLDVNYVEWCPLQEHSNLLLSCGDDNEVRIWEI